MQNVARMRDRTLDYLFQESVEEQFEDLRMIQDKPEQRFTFSNLFTRWFKSESESPQASDN